MLGDNRYGKGNVRFLRVIKDKPRHEVHLDERFRSGRRQQLWSATVTTLRCTVNAHGSPQEFTGQIMLHGDFSTAFTAGTNETLVPTETQKNTMYALSKKYNVDPVERWVFHAARDVMRRHPHVKAVDMEFVRTPWARVQVKGDQHNHAFLRAADGHHFVRASSITPTGYKELVAGFKNLRIMKTTQSGFEGFIVDQYTTLKPTADRIMCTDVHCEYRFNADIDVDKTPFGEIGAAIKQMTVEHIAGPADKGVYSASVQQTIHQIGTAVLARFPLLSSIKFVLPNIHYYPVDFGDFRDASIENKREVFLTFDGAHGQIEAEIVRKPSAKL